MKLRSGPIFLALVAVVVAWLVGPPSVPNHGSAAAPVAGPEVAHAAATDPGCQPTGPRASPQDCLTAQRAAAGGARMRLTGPTTFYVDTINGNDGNFPGITTGASAFASIQGALDAIQQKVDINGQPWMIQHSADGSAMAPGRYAPFVVDGQFVGDKCGGSIVGAPPLAITGATNASPIVITAADHGYRDGEAVAISGVGGNTAANGVWTIAGATPSTFALAGSAGNGPYGSGGTVQNIAKVTISGSGQAVTARNGACVAVSGFNISSSNAQLVMAIDKGTVVLGRNQYGQSGSAWPQLWASRHGLVWLTDSYGFSSTGAAMFNFMQASHQGQIRQDGARGFALSDVAYDAATGFLYSDYGDITTSMSPAGVPFSANGFAVTGKKFSAIEGGAIQVEGHSPPSQNAVPGSSNGTLSLTSASDATLYTPSVSSGAGSIRAARATGRWFRIGQMIFVQMTIIITDNGTGKTSVIGTLPFPANATDILSGRETAVTGKTVTGFTTAGSSNLNMTFYDNSYPGGAGANVISISGVYEMQP